MIGASHAGVNFAFALRKEGWEGQIMLIDSDPNLPYHRPPLSKAYLFEGDSLEPYLLKSKESYQKEAIELRLGISVEAINRQDKSLVLANGDIEKYDKLVIATGARARIPKIEGIDKVSHLYPLRNAEDVQNIKQRLTRKRNPKAIVIGGGYIGLETAASLKKMGAQVKIIEREERILQRVTSYEMSQFFFKLHEDNGVEIITNKEVVSFESFKDGSLVKCSDLSEYQADIIILGVGILVNSELAENAGLGVENGIVVNDRAQTTDKDIYAIGDCTLHYNTHFSRYIRLECVQNAVDQAKVAAASICEKEVSYNAIPWFWSDQYDVKLQMVGLSERFDHIVSREEIGEITKFSLWYFRNERLIAVDAVNNAKAYVIGTKFIKENTPIDINKLADNTVALKPQNLLVN